LRTPSQILSSEILRHKLERHITDENHIKVLSGPSGITKLNGSKVQMLCLIKMREWGKAGILSLISPKLTGNYGKILNDTKQDKR